MKGTWKALAFLAAIAGVALAVSTSALGAGSNVSPTRWRMSLGAAGWSGRLAALYPGARNNAELLSFTVTNAGQARHRLSQVVASVPANRGGDAETAAGGNIRGCRANWFAVVVDRANRALPVQLAAGATYRGRVELTMRNSGTNQNACRGASPAVSVTAG